MDEMVRARPVNQATLLSVFFFAFAIAAIGLPPLSGFVGKALLLQSASRLAEQVWVWPALLISSLMALVAFTRAGSTFFWHVSPKDASGGRNDAVDPNGCHIHFAVYNRIDDRFRRFDFGIQPGGRQRYSQAPDHHTTAEPDRQEPNP
jgi:formate hydrogenlyase subunit 3/multisubunit Na+/H+ antiporter MnhD subunit